MMFRSFYILLFLVALEPSTASSDPFRLQSGELIEHSEYQTLHILGGPKRLALKVTFAEQPPEPNTRNASLLEIMTTHLLPMGISKGFSEVSIWETRVEGSAGPEQKPFFSFKATAGVYENYDFVLGDKWIWAQTFGPELDLTDAQISEFSYNEDLQLNITDAYPRLLDDGEMYLEIWASAENAAPQEAIEKANGLFKSLSGCVEDGVPIAHDSFIAQQGAIALRIYLVPFKTSSPLQFQPRVKLTYGHEKGVATCYTASTDQYGSWDKLYSSLSK